jgi:hypothetical protein
VTVVPVVSAVQRVGFQNNLNYGQFQLDSALIQQLAPIKAASGKNVAVVLPTTSLEAGSVSLNPQNTVIKSGAIKAFDLIQFFFGCTTFLANSQADVDLGCGIEVSGYNTAGKMVGIASFNYAPDAAFGADLVKAELPASFINLINVTFAVATSSVAVTDTALVLDNVTHINYW